MSVRREMVCYSKQTVRCYRSIYKCSDKNVKSSKQMYMSLHFNSQCIVQENIMLTKRNITFLRCAFKSRHPIFETLLSAQYSMLNHLIKQTVSGKHTHTISSFFIFSVSLRLSHEHTHVRLLIKS